MPRASMRVAFAVSAVTGTGPVPFALDAQGRYTVDSIKTLTPFMLAGRIDPPRHRQHAEPQFVRWQRPG